MSSSIDPSLPPLKPTYTASPDAEESKATQELINNLGLLKHIEGGYFKEIDRNPLIIPNPFYVAGREEEGLGKTAGGPRSGDDTTRTASTSIYYLLTRNSPLGAFHRNKGRTVHTLIKGRGRYVLIHADEPGSKKRIETFVVGRNVAEGEKVCWVVEGGKFKGTCLLEGDGDEGLLISETVIPGFEYSDHDFMTQEKYEELVTEEQAKELAWMVRKDR
ncbi:RmlC-like cupin domain-containing protein [Lophiotrema nucula]|uniref:RmlC-like cupin domain-containing protein n=1 Tax=Lophiotrema nucula TaxID=690887 RepID=A0A6A5ZUD6_9PLEO|nr:RmlC-like cupin domain-containing protein [Lophiotrema nucula]